MKIDWPGVLKYRAPKLTQRELPGLLFISAHEAFSPVNLCIGVAVLAGGPVYLLTHLRTLHGGDIFGAVVALCVGSWSVYTALNPDTATLEITTGVARARSRHGSATLNRMDIRELLFQAGDGEDSPQGLYAPHGWGTALLLPYVTEEQAFEIKDVIYRMFPDTPSGYARPSDLISLNLNR